MYGLNNFKFVIQVFERGITQDQVILMAARASRTENQDAIDTAIVGMLADPKEVCCIIKGFKQRLIITFLTWWAESVYDFVKARAGIQEVHFLPFNPTDKRTALTYIDSDGKMFRVSKGAPEQVPHESSIN